MSNLEIVGLKNNIKSDYIIDLIKSQIINRINDLKLNNIKYRYCNEFLLLVANLIEYLSNKKDKIDKFNLLYEIFCEVFDLDKSNVDERLMLLHNVNFLHSNGSIKKISKWKLFKCGVYEYFSGKKCLK